MAQETAAAPFRDIVLLGAGASMAAGFPSASRLTQHLEVVREAMSSLPVSPGILTKVDEDLQWLRDVQTRLSGLSRQLRGFDPQNIEDIFRVWGHELPATTTARDAPRDLIPGYQYPRLIRLLAIALSYSPRYPSLRQFSQHNVYSWLIDQLCRLATDSCQGEATVVTTNYDLLVEFAVATRPDLDLTYTYNDRSDLQNLFGREKTSRCMLHYLKLHGSVNWWGRDRGLRVTRDSAAGMVQCDSPLAAIAARYADVGEDIEMVPPAILKDVIYRRNWSEVWEEAYAAFCKCRRLIIIGYSFSPGDVLVQDMATLGLARSPFLESIAVIDPNADQVISNLKSYYRRDFISRIKWHGHSKPFDDVAPTWMPSVIS